MGIKDFLRGLLMADGIKAFCPGKASSENHAEAGMIFMGYVNQTSTFLAEPSEKQRQMFPLPHLGGRDSQWRWEMGGGHCPHQGQHLS